MNTDLRERLAEAFERPEPFEAMQVARDLVGEDSGARQWRFLRTSVQGLAPGAAGLKSARVALLSSFSIELVHDALVGTGLLNGLRIELYQAGFGQYHQEIANPGSGLYAFSPEAAILAIEGERLAPGLYDSYLDHTEDQISKEIETARGEIELLVSTFRARSDAILLVHGVDPPSLPLLGVLDGHLGEGQKQAINGLNAALYQIARNYRGVYVVDIAAIHRRYGTDRWHDGRMALYAGAPIAQAMMPALSAEYCKFLRAWAGQTKKCLVTDLDNTLWGGILGEDGLAGIKLGLEYPGSAFMAYQRALLNLHRRGVILAIASKNNPEDVDEVFAQHPHMLLGEEHFSHREIHWEPKSQSLEKIAQTLNIGLEHIVLVDDNPAEAAQVRSALPRVTVITFPSRPEQAVRAIMEEGLFDGLYLSAEDGKRSELYRQRAQAETLRASATSLREFYESLEMRMIIQPVTPQSLPRAAQLTQKTNQFNLTTYRYDEAEIERRMQDPGWWLLTIQVIDRFGDNGIVGLIMAHADDSLVDIDTLLLSCRVIGRTIETAMLAALCRRAAAAKIPRLRGAVIPTKKNAPARGVYERHGFTKSAGEGEEASIWELDLRSNSVDIPPWIRVVEE